MANEAKPAAKDDKENNLIQRTAIMQVVRKYLRAYDKEVDCIVINVPEPTMDKWGNESYDDCYDACRQWLVDNYNYSDYVVRSIASCGFVENNIVLVAMSPVKFHFAVNFIQEN